MKKDPQLAAILSFLMPGLGQGYCGRWLRALGVFSACLIGYCCLVLPGIAVWVWGKFDARDIAKESKE